MTAHEHHPQSIVGDFVFGKNCSVGCRSVEIDQAGDLGFFRAETLFTPDHSERAIALPAPHLPPSSSARSRKSESASPPFFPPHDGRDAPPIDTRLSVLAWQLQRYCVAIRSIFGKAIRDLADENI